jgi:hypothetical protein
VGQLRRESGFKVFAVEGGYGTFCLKTEQVIIRLEADASGKGQRQPGTRVKPLTVADSYTRADTGPLEKLYRLGVREKSQTRSYIVSYDHQHGFARSSYLLISLFF